MERLREASRHRWPWIVLAMVVAQMIWTSQMIGLRWEHYLANALFLVPTWLMGEKGRRFTFLCLPLWLVGFSYENFRFVEHLRSSTIHVADLYQAEIRWFGVAMGDKVVTIPEWFAAYNHWSLDFASGMAYIVYLFEPLLLTMVFVFLYPERCKRLGWAFLTVNIIGMMTYLAYPAAPPWYVMANGLGPVDLHAAPSAAGAIRFDQLTGTNYFAGFYSRNANVFGAMPSLHAAYPLVVYLSVIGMGLIWTVPTLLFALLVGFAAVYLQHHYLIDVVVGYGYAFAAMALTMAVQEREVLLKGPSEWYAALRMKKNPA